MNLVAGFISVIVAINGDLVTSSWLILIAMIFDFLDGFSARLLKAYSAIGKELDSLADLVSFGVAPAIILYELLITSLPTPGALFPSEGITPAGIAILLPFVLMPVGAALRLAKFNTDETQATSFKGVPTPANALAVTGIVLAAHYSGSPILTTLIKSPVSLALISIILSVLMVTRIPLFSLKTGNLAFKGNEQRYIFAVLVIISFLVTGAGGFALIVPLYLMISLLSLLF